MISFPPRYDHFASTRIQLSFQAFCLSYHAAQADCGAGGLRRVNSEQVATVVSSGKYTVTHIARWRDRAGGPRARRLQDPCHVSDVQGSRAKCENVCAIFRPENSIYMYQCINWTEIILSLDLTDGTSHCSREHTVYSTAVRIVV